MGNCQGVAAGFCRPCDDIHARGTDAPGHAAGTSARLAHIEDAAQRRAARVRPSPVEALAHDRWCHVPNIPLFLPERVVRNMRPESEAGLITQFVHGSGLGLVDTVKACIANGVKINAVDSMDWTALQKVRAPLG